jgi:hypothetical protein
MKRLERAGLLSGAVEPFDRSQGMLLERLERAFVS